MQDPRDACSILVPASQSLRCSNGKAILRERFGRRFAFCRFIRGATISRHAWTSQGKILGRILLPNRHLGMYCGIREQGTRFKNAMNESIALSPKTRFTSDKAAASAHTDLMASPQFQTAASLAMLTYQQQVVTRDPAGFTAAAAKLRGAHEFLETLLNLGLQTTPRSTPDNEGLVPPEEALNRPYKPPTK